MDPGLAGLTLNHAAVVANGSFTDYTLVSNPVPVTLVP